MQQLRSSEPAIRGGDTSHHRDETAHQAEEETVKAPVHAEHYLASVLVPRAASTRDITVLETAMQGLAPDAKHPVALELAATASSRHFLLRATSTMSQRHLADQIQARYPQSTIRQLAQEDDPLALREGEVVSAVELRAGAAAYLPLRTSRASELLQEGADPLLGILGVFNHLPPHMRVVTQLALIPAPPTWSHAYRRKSVEHPLEQERLRARRELSGAQGSGPGTFQLVGMGVLVALLLVWWRFQRQLDALIPSWLLQAGLSLLRGRMPQLSSAHLVALAIGSIAVLVALFCFAFMVLQIRSRMAATPIYDMRLVDEKTARPAYRARLRLFVFSRGHGAAPAYHAHLLERLLHDCTWQPYTWPSLMSTYQGWRETARLHKQCEQEQRDILDHLVAAYRQYHTAAGGYFVSRRVSRGKIRRLLIRRKRWIRSRVSGWHHDLARSPHLLSVADLAALWHLPQAQDLSDLPYVEHARARTALAPAELSLGQGWKLGTSSHAGHSVPVYLPSECLGHNLLTVASTGKGKSTLFQHLAQAVCMVRAGMKSASAPGLAFI